MGNRRREICRLKGFGSKTAKETSKSLWITHSFETAFWSHLPNRLTLRSCRTCVISLEHNVLSLHFNEKRNQTKGDTEDIIIVLQYNVLCRALTLWTVSQGNTYRRMSVYRFLLFPPDTSKTSHLQRFYSYAFKFPPLKKRVLVIVREV